MNPQQADLPAPDFGSGATRTRDAHEAEAIVAEHFVDNRLDLTGASGALDMRLEGARFGQLTAGRLAYGRAVRLISEPTTCFAVDFVLRGRATLRDNLGGHVEAEAGQGAVYSPGSRPEMVFSADCVILGLMVSRARLESQVEAMLGRRAPEPLAFEFALRPDGEPGRRLLLVLDLLQAELSDPVLGRLDSLDRHLETLVLGALLVAQPNNVRDVLLAHGPAPGSVVRRAVDVLHQDPGATWTSGRLAAEVHLSVRALQEGFSRELGVPPMPYLRQVRLQRVHEGLSGPGPDATVGGVAGRFGFSHLGRFARHYQDRYGELPSATLARAREEKAATGA